MRKVHNIFLQFIDNFIKSSEIELKVAEQKINILKNYGSIKIFPDDSVTNENLKNISQINVCSDYNEEDNFKNRIMIANLAKEEICKLERIIEAKKVVISFCQEIRYGIECDGFCMYLDDIEPIYRLMYVGNDKLKFNEEEQVAFIGKIIRSNATLYKSNKEIANFINKVEKTSKPYAKACVLLKDYFNEDGSLVAQSDKSSFKANLQAFFKASSGADFETQQGFKECGCPTYDEFISMALRVLDKTNENDAKLKEEQLKLAEEKELAAQRSIQNKIETEIRIKNCQVEYKNQRHQDAIKRNAILELSKYYLDGEFITIPPEANTLVALLNSAGYDAERIKIILDKRNTYINEIEHRRIYLKYLTEDEYDVYLKAVKRKDNLTLNSVISDLDTAIMLEEELEEKDEEFQNEINELVMQMQTIMKNINLTFN